MRLPLVKRLTTKHAISRGKSGPNRRFGYGTFFIIVSVSQECVLFHAVNINFASVEQFFIFAFL